MRYVLTLNDQDWEITSSEDLRRYLQQVRSAGRGEVWLRQVLGTMKGFEALCYRILGLNTEREGSSIGALVNGDVATLTFLNSAGEEWIGINPSEPPAAGNVEFTMGNGQQVEQPASNCVPADSAFAAIERFYERGRRPDTVTWRKTD